eukprot:4329307-Pyramimonas_sp.AAC.1
MGISADPTSSGAGGPAARSGPVQHGIHTPRNSDSDTERIKCAAETRQYPAGGHPTERVPGCISSGPGSVQPPFAGPAQPAQPSPPSIPQSAGSLEPAQVPPPPTGDIPNN